jgi:hypothetical protein
MGGGYSLNVYVYYFYTPFNFIFRKYNFQIQGLGRGDKKLYHIIAGCSSHSESENMKLSDDDALSRFGNYALNYLRALECRIARHLNYSKCHATHPEEDCSVMLDDIDSITLARDAVLLRIVSSFPAFSRVES